MGRPWIKQAQVSGFMCLRSVSVDLEPLTVLVGKNDTGKTSFLKAIGVLANAPSVGGDLAQLVRKGASMSELRVRAEYSDGTQAVVQPTNQKLVQTGNGFAHLARVQYPYRFDLAKLRNPAHVGQLGDAPLPADGSSFVAALDRLPFKQFSKLQEQLIARVPTLNDVRFSSPSAGIKEIWFDVKGAGPIPIRQMSDGVVLLLAILTVLNEENPPSLLMIEEPETGIHPKQLERVMELFVDLTRQGVQILLTTHSPYLLDFVPKNSVRVFTRSDSGEVAIRPFEAFEEIRDMLSRGFTRGEAWYNSDEDELIRGAKDENRTAQ